MAGIYLSIVIPMYNESKNLERGVLTDVAKYLSNKKFSWEILISDDGSTDGSGKIVTTQIQNLSGFKLLENSHGGKPHALFEGLKKAKGEYVLFTDMDQSTPIGELDKFLANMKGEYSAIIGSRGVDRKNFPFYRKLGSAVFMAFRKLFILSDINDTQCGFKVFKREVVLLAFPKLEFFRVREKVTGWKVTSYDVELLHIIQKMGGKIKEVKVKWQDEDKSGSKGGKLSRYVKESKEMLVQILRVKMNDLKGMYETK